MKKCLLCQNHPADKKGSHIVPHFLSKRIDNEPGQTGRDKELGFVITEGSTSSYFGRSVQPEILKEIYGEVTDELIEENKVEGIEDHYFCSGCETRLSVVENEYAKTIEQATKTEQNYTSIEQPFVGFLFWISIIWRLSIQEYSGFKLKAKEEKKLRRIIDTYLKDSIEKITPNKKDIDLNDIGYKLIRAPKFSDTLSTWLHWSTIYERPYSIVIDEYILFLYFKKAHLKGMPLEFYGSERFKNQAEYVTPFKSETIFGITNVQYKTFSEKIALFGATKRMQFLSHKLDLLHHKLGGRGKRMNIQLKGEILKRIANSDVELGNKNTPENHIKIISETIVKLNKN